jgi:hypothetical protein
MKRFNSIITHSKRSNQNSECTEHGMRRRVRRRRDAWLKVDARVDANVSAVKCRALARAVAFAVVARTAECAVRACVRHNTATRAGRVGRVGVVDDADDAGTRARLGARTADFGDVAVRRALGVCAQAARRAGERRRAARVLLAFAAELACLARRHHGLEAEAQIAVQGAPQARWSAGVRRRFP